MRSISFTRLIAAGALAFTLSPAFADQTQGIDLTAGEYLNIRDPYIGVGYRMPVAPRWSVEPNAEYVFVRQGNMYTFNVDGHYLLNPSSRNPMYVGAGLGMIRRTRPFYDSTDTAMNLSWGVDFDGYSGPVTPFINTKAVFSNNSDFSVSFGIRFDAGGSTGSSTAMNSSRAIHASKVGS